LNFLVSVKVTHHELARDLALSALLVAKIPEIGDGSGLRLIFSVDRLAKVLFKERCTPWPKVP